MCNENIQWKYTMKYIMKIYNENMQWKDAMKIYNENMQ